MKYLVTGGAGFLGSHLCDALISRGDSVVCIDNLLTGSFDNINQLLDEPRFSYIIDDVLVCGLPLEVDGIFHLASAAAPKKIMEFSKEVYDINSKGTKRLQEYAIEHNAKFLFVSSMKVRGDCKRVQAYIDGKREGERIAKTGKIARLASVYGPRMLVNDSRVIPQFVTQALKGEPLELWNEGAQQDSFCYVSDIVEFLLRFMDSNAYGVFEAGDPIGITIKALAEIIINITKSKSSFNFRNVEVSQQCHNTPDISAAIKYLKWQPKISLEEGIGRVAQFFDNRVKEYVHSYI